MNSRERILKAINHEETDKVPVDFGSMRSTGISTAAYSKLLKMLGLKDRIPRMYDFIQQLAYPDKEILDLFSVDAIDASQAFLDEDKCWSNWTLEDGTECLIPYYLNIEKDENGTVYLKDSDETVMGIKPKNSLYVNQSYYVYGHMDRIPSSFSKEDLKKNMWKLTTTPYHLDIFDNTQFDQFVKKIKGLREESDYAIMLSVGCNLFEGGTRLRGMENFLCDIYIDKKGTNRLLNALAENYLVFLERIIGGVGQYVDILMFGGDDLGSHNAPFMSPEIFSEIFEPQYKKLWDYVHDNSKCKVFLHSCGSIFRLIPNLIEAGLDILNPVQTTANEMDALRLKKEYGRDITFWGGGCNTRDVLPAKSPEKVKEDVRKRIDIFGKGGGFVFAQIHNILSDVPPENIIAMFEAVNDY